MRQAKTAQKVLALDLDDLSQEEKDEFAGDAKVKAFVVGVDSMVFMMRMCMETLLVC